MKISELQNKLSVFLVDQALKKEQSISLEVDGRVEKYVRCRFRGIEICLYDDGFDLQGHDIDVRFESDDIASIEDAVCKLGLELDTLK